jgi:hypothetical protein
MAWFSTPQFIYFLQWKMLVPSVPALSKRCPFLRDTASTQSFPVRTTGQWVLHSCLHLRPTQKRLVMEIAPSMDPSYSNRFIHQQVSSNHYLTISFFLDVLFSWGYDLSIFEQSRPYKKIQERHSGMAALQIWSGRNGETWAEHGTWMGQTNIISLYPITIYIY